LTRRRNTFIYCASGANITDAGTDLVTLARGTRVPQPGETLILTDGRRFTFSSAEAGSRGWWFTALATDGSSELQGNLRLVWDEEEGVWRPSPIHLTSGFPQTLNRRVQRRHKQPD
jgi:hypothetical protein